MKLWQNFLYTSSKGAQHVSFLRLPVMFLLLLGCILGSVEAQTVDPQQACTGNDTDPATKVLACTALIQARRLPSGQAISPKMLADFYADRSAGYEIMRDYERARDDHKAALSFYPAAQVNIDRLQVEVDWVHYLKEIQGEYDYANWSAPPFDSFWSTKK